MCIVSMIMDDFKGRWEHQFPIKPLTPPTVWPAPGDPLPRLIPLRPERDDIPDVPTPLDVIKGVRVTITYEEWTDYMRLKRAAAEQDVREGNPDCEKPELQKWEDELKAQLIKQGTILPEDC